MKISADFDVDPANEVYKAAENGNPFVEVSINSLKVKEANAQTIAPADTAEYKENLQFQVDEHVAINGIKLAGQEVDEITIGLYASLDLVNTTENKTKFRLFAHVKSNPDYMDAGTWSQDKYPIDVTYANGRLVMTTDSTASIIQAMGLGLFPYDMLLAKPIGNLIDSILPAAEKEKFDSLYWSVKPGQKDDQGQAIAPVWNPNFHGLIIEHLTVNDILGLIIPEQQASAASSAEEEEGNIYNTILYAFSLIANAKDGQLTNDLAGTVANFVKYATGANWTIKSMADAIKQFVNGAGLGAALSVLDFNGNSKGDAIEMLLTGVKLNAKFDLTDGINWEIDIIRHEEVRDEENKLTTPGTHIKWTSSIRFDETEIPISDETAMAAYNAAKAEYEKDYAAKKDDFDTKEAAYKAANDAIDKAEAELKAIKEGSTYFDAYSAYLTAHENYDATYEKLMATPGIGVSNISNGSIAVAGGSIAEQMKKYHDDYDKWTSNPSYYEKKLTEYVSKIEELIPQVTAAMKDIANLKKAYQDAQDAYVADSTSANNTAKTNAKKAITDVLKQYNQGWFNGNIGETQVFYVWFSRYDAYSKAGKPEDGKVKTDFDEIETLLNETLAKYDENKIQAAWYEEKILVKNHAEKKKAYLDAEKAMKATDKGQAYVDAQNALLGSDGKGTKDGPQKEYEDAKKVLEDLENVYRWYYWDVKASA